MKLDAAAVEAHLRGTSTIGTYAICADDSCIFLACDFDGKGWQDDVKTYMNAARSMGVDVAVERSRSGAGAHAWIFFQEPVPARLARLLGTVILSKCSEYRPSMSLESFDRFFPNQDYLPKGGFGNDRPWQSEHLTFGFPQTPRTHSLAQTGEYPFVPFDLFSQSLG